MFRKHGRRKRNVFLPLPGAVAGIVWKYSWAGLTLEGIYFEQNISYQAKPTDLVS